MEKRTDFDPSVHGFQFSNQFETTTWIGSQDLTFGGRCGGMVYAALDHYNNGLSIPPTSWYDNAPIPPDGHTLGNYIYNRQTACISNIFGPVCERTLPSLTKWFDRGIKGGPDFEAVKDKVNANEPVPIVLLAVNQGIIANHVVCVIGYDEGDGAKHDLKVYVYDPNAPYETPFLIPVPSKTRFEEYVRTGNCDLDAALSFSPGLAYFFKDGMYIRYKPDDIGFVGGIRAIGQSGWDDLPTLFHRDLDAALMYSDGYVYFFKGDKCVRYDPQTDTAGSLTAIEDLWLSFPPYFHSNLDAALMYDTNDHAYFFKGGKYIKFKPGGTGVVGGVKTIGVSGWKSFPRSFRSNLDAAYMHPNGHAYFFKGDEYIKFKPNHGVVGGVRETGLTGWKSYPKEFSGVRRTGKWLNYFVDNAYRSNYPPQPGDSPSVMVDWSNTDHSRAKLDYRDITNYKLLQDHSRSSFDDWV